MKTQAKQENGCFGRKTLPKSFQIAYSGLPDIMIPIFKAKPWGRTSVVATRITADGAVYVGGTATIVANGELMV